MKREKLTARRGGDQPDKVGYRRPPKRTQFQKGQSGNPKGRSKGSKGLAALLNDVLKEKVPLGTTGKKITAREAIVRRQIINALKGDTKAFNAIWSAEKESDSGKKLDLSLPKTPSAGVTAASESEHDCD